MDILKIDEEHLSTVIGREVDCYYPLSDLEGNVKGDIVIKFGDDDPMIVLSPLDLVCIYYLPFMMKEGSKINIKISSEAIDLKMGTFETRCNSLFDLPQRIIDLTEFYLISKKG